MQHVASIQIIVQGTSEQAQEEINRLAATLVDAGYDVLGWGVEGEHPDPEEIDPS